MSKKVDIKISSLPEEYQKWANKNDKDKSKSINSIMEYNNVVSDAKNAGQTDDDINLILGWQAEGLDKDQKKSKKSEVKTDIEAVISEQPKPENFNLENMSAAIKSKLGNKMDEAYYQKLMQQVDNVIDLMKSFPYGNRSSVRNVYYQTEKALDKLPNNEFKSFSKDVLKTLILALEKDQMQKEKDKVLARYDQLKSEGKSREEAMKTLRSEFKGYYFEDYESSAYGEEDNPEAKKTQHYGVITLIEKGEVMTEARKEVWDVIYECKNNPKYTTPESIKKHIEEVLTPKDGKLDKYTKKVLSGERSLREILNFEPSVTLEYIKKVATDNSVDGLKEKPLDEKYFTDKLKNKALFEALTKKTDTQNPLIVLRTNEDGTLIVDENGNKQYDLSALSDLIASKLGANSKADMQLSEMEVLSEVQQALEGVLANLDCKNVKLTSKDTKNLIKLCGFPVEGKNWWKIALDTVDKTLFNGATGLLTALVIPQETVRGTVNGVAEGIVEGTVDGTVSGIAKGDIPVTIEINNNSEIKFNLTLTGGATMSTESLLDLAAQVRQYGGSLSKSVDEAGNTIYSIVINSSDTTKIEQILTGQELPFEEGFSKEFKEKYKKEYSEDYEKKAGNNTKMKMFVTRLILDAAVNFMTAAFGYQKAEKPVIPTQFDEKTIEGFNSRVDAMQKLNQAQKNALKLLATAYYDTTTKEFDCEGLKLKLNEIAGDAGVVNKIEFEIGMFEAKKEIEANKIKAEDEKKANDETKTKDETKTPADKPVDSPAAAPTVDSTPIVEPTKDVITVQKIEGETTTIPFTWKIEYSWQAVVATYYPQAFKDKNTMKSVVDAFRKAHGISDRSNIPTGQTFNLGEIVVNGKTYKPEKDEKGKRLQENTSDDKYGWGSAYFDPNWNVQTEGVSTVKSKEAKSPDKYKATRKSDGKEATADSAEDAARAVTPKEIPDTLEIQYPDGRKEKIVKDK